MKITDGERLIALMLADIMQSQKISTNIDPQFVAGALIDGDEWMLDRKYSGVFGRDSNARDGAVDETYDIFMMFQSIRYATNQLPAAEQDEIKALPWYEFAGFDGNHDAHHGIAHNIINNLGHYTAFQPLNSHSQTTLPHYRQMLPQWREMTNGHVNALTADQLRVLCA